MFRPAGVTVCVCAYVCVCVCAGQCRCVPFFGLIPESHQHLSGWHVRQSPALFRLTCETVTSTFQADMWDSHQHFSRWHVGQSPALFTLTYGTVTSTFHAHVGQSPALFKLTRGTIISLCEEVQIKRLGWRLSMKTGEVRWKRAVKVPERKSCQLKENAFCCAESHSQLGEVRVT